MNTRFKSVAKKIIYPSMDILDAAIPPLSTLLTRFFYVQRAVINDLHIPSTIHYEPLGIYPTFYASPPSRGWYKRYADRFRFDGQGVPQCLDKYSGAFYYNPVAIAQHGAAEYGYYLSTKDERHRENCLRAAKGLLRLQDEKGGWPYPIDYPVSREGGILKSGWYSAMAQGQAVSLFVRANTLEPDPAYCNASNRALKLLEIPVGEGGLLAKLGGYDFYEEYPTIPPSYTLNGFLFCLFGLYDGFQIFRDERARRLFQNGFQTLKAVLPLYDGAISSYDLFHVTYPPLDRLRNRKYHILHVKLLQALDSVQHEDVFTFYFNKWGKHWR